MHRYPLSFISSPRSRVLRLLGAGALVLALPLALAGQGSPGVVALDRDGSVLSVGLEAAQVGTGSWWAAVHAGSRGLGGGHLFGGIEGGIVPGRFGGGGAIQLGSGNDYASTLLGGGAAARVLERDGFELLAWAGPAWYGETLDSGPSRSAIGGILSLTLRREVGPGVLSLHGGFFNGTVDEDGFEESHGVSAFRFAIGFGR